MVRLSQARSNQVRMEGDRCLFPKDGRILVVYVDDVILISLNKVRIMAEIKSLES